MPTTSWWWTKEPVIGPPEGFPKRGVYNRVVQEVEAAFASLRWALITPMCSAILATVLSDPGFLHPKSATGS